MEEKINTKTTKGDTSPLIYIALILLGMAAIAYASYYVPVMIFALLLLAPISLKYDMELNKPILSIGLAAITAVFVYFTKDSYSLYIILTISTGLSVAAGYILYYFMSPEKFSDGVPYSILFSVFAAIMTALVIFILRERQSFAAEIVDGITAWLSSSQSQFVNYYTDALYNYMHALNSNDTQSFAEIINIFSGTVDLGSDLTKAQKINYLLPYIQTGVNRYAISAMIFYPAFAGGVTWWRGNYRYYKNKPVTEEIMAKKPKPFSTFTVPRRLFGITVLMLILSFILQASNYGEKMYYAADAMQNFAYLLLFLQGLAVLEYFLKRTTVLRNAFLRVIAIILITSLSYGFIPLFFGMVDLFINIRQVYRTSQELKTKIVRRPPSGTHGNDDDKDDKTK